MDPAHENLLAIAVICGVLLVVLLVLKSIARKKVLEGTGRRRARRVIRRR